jgi:hypothetical protein
MPRKYSKELIDSLDIIDNTLGTQLAKICIEAFTSDLSSKGLKSI